MRRTLGWLAVLGLLLCGEATGQQSVWVSRTPGWLGISYEVRWAEQDGRCEPRVLVEQVVQGSPAERAGLRAGDAITELDGDGPAAGLLRVAAAGLTPGDTVHLRFERGGVSREATAVADRRPDRPPRVILRSQSGFAASTAPIVWMAGDTLVARNLDEAVRRPGGYWYAFSDGRTEYRSLPVRPRDDLDRRVSDLIQCAELATRSAAPNRMALRQFQARADSLRVVFSRRALERDPDTEDFEVRVHEIITGPDPARGPIRIERSEGENTYVFRLDDRLMEGLRGVAGAELTELEPTLAEYFDNASEGVLVLRVAERTPAARAGLRPGDVIVRAAGRAVETVGELRSLLARTDPGSTELRVVRKGRVHTLTLPRP